MATKAKTSKRFTEIGSSGVQIFDGIISGEEYNYKLTGRNALQTWEEMRRSDAQTKMTLKVIQEPVKAMKFHIQPGSDEERDLDIAAKVDANLFGRLRFKTTLGEVLTFQPMGFSVFEKVWTYGELDGTDMIYLDKLAFRKQTSIAKWETVDHKPGVCQYGAGSTLLSLPLDKIVVFTNEQEGDNYEGISIFRAAYKHWYYKDKLYQIDAIGHERQSLGVVKIKHPKNAPDKQIKEAESAARALRANEEAFLKEPEGWSVEMMDMKATSLKDTAPSINHHNRQIAVNVLAGFMDLGSTSGSGSRSVGETQLKIFEQAIKSVADYIADTFNRYVIKDFVDLNYNNVDQYPKLVAGEVSGESLTELATALKNLVDAGIIDPTPEDETYLRGILGLPERPAGDEETQDDDEPDGEAKTSPKGSDDEEQDDIDDADLPDAKKASVVDRAKQVLASLKEKLYGGSSRAS